MKNSGASNSGPIGQSSRYDAFMDVDQPSNSTPPIGPDPSMGFDQASHSLPGAQSLVQPDASTSFTEFDQAGNPIPNGPYLGEDPSMNFDPSLASSFDFTTNFDPTLDFSPIDFSNIDFSSIDFSNMITPPLSPPADPSNVTATNGPPVFTTLPAPASTEQEIIALHAQLPREHHVLAQGVDEGLHNILALLNSALATLDTAPDSKPAEPTTDTTNSTTIETATDATSCLAHLPQLMQACHALQADGAKLCQADRGGYGVLCRTFQLVAYRFDLYRMWPEIVFEDWFEVFVGMRERIGRMGRDGLFAVARGEGGRCLGVGMRIGEVKEEVEGTETKAMSKSGRGGKGVGKVKVKVEGEGKGGKVEKVKWERDGDGRLIKR